MGTYRTSTGERWSQQKLDREIRKAKQQVKDYFLAEWGYIYCVDCGKNENVGIIDMSHDISVQKCKDNGQADLAADFNNIKPRCRECHQKYDGLNLWGGQ